MEYVVIQEMSLHDLIAKVNEAIRNGWKPQGGIHHTDQTATGYSVRLWFASRIGQSAF
jgi:hypothetical protein